MNITTSIFLTSMKINIIFIFLIFFLTFSIIESIVYKDIKEKRPTLKLDFADEVIVGGYGVDTLALSDVPDLG